MIISQAKASEHPAPAATPLTRAMIGFGTQVFGVIDVRTNSVKFHLAERRPDGAARVVVDRAEVTRLESYIEAADAILRIAAGSLWLS